MIDVNSRTSHGRLVIRVRGQLTGPSCAQFMKAVESVKDTACARALVDLAEVNAIESTGVGAVLYVHALLARTGKKVVFMAHGAVRDLLATCGLDKVALVVDTDHIVDSKELVAERLGA
jgi:anti-anti-sigma factor